MIKLTRTIDHCMVFINPMNIDVIIKDPQGDTCIQTNNRQLWVKETPEQILSLMNENPLNKLRDELDLLDFQNIPGYSQPFYDAADVWRIINKYIPEEDDD